MGYAMMIDQVQHQAVEKVLQDYLNGDELNSAVNLWQKQYSDQPMEKLTYFVFEIATSSTLRNLRKQILLDLEKNLKQDEPETTIAQEKINTEIIFETQLEPQINLIETAVVQQQQEAIEQVAVIAIEALDDCCKTLFKVFEHIELGELVAVFKENFAEGSIMPKPMQDELLLMLVAQHKPQHLVYEQDYVRATFNVIYTVMCEYFGPVKADHYLARAVAQTEQRYPQERLAKFL